MALLGAAMGCFATPASPSPRDPAPVAPGWLDELSPRPSLPPWGLRLSWRERTADFERYEFSFERFDEAVGAERVTGDLYAPLDRTAQAPLLDVAPILAGPVDDYLASRWVCEAAAERRIASFFIHQETWILADGRDALELEAELGRNIRANRDAITVLSRLHWIDGTRVASLGISLGAIKSVALAASEMRLRASVFLLGGADLASMLESSREALVASYLAERRSIDGAPTESVAAEFRRWFVSEPRWLAGHVAADRAAVFLARLDDKVPYANGRLLWCLLGRPELHVGLWGHYTAVVAAPYWIGVALDWIESSWSRSGA
jgi:hypothetical protein